uniref:G-protein coupled receptors family 1 profile domain-containing protein n=2 Tax=Monopterus albus TaxID=43700 RepID=A0A3Q3J2D0_MONAL
NALVVCVLVKHRNQSNLTDICLLNLAVSDILFVLTLPFHSHYSVVEKWVFGDFLCHLLSGCHYTGFFTSIFFMVVMTLDRYMIIVHAHKVARYRTLRAGIALTVAVWLLSLVVSLPTFIFTKVTTDDPESPGCSYNPENKAWNNYTLFSAFILGLVVPLLVMIVCYSRIIPTLVNMRTAKKHRVVKLIILIVTVFFLFWAPYYISRFLRFLQTEDIFSSDCTTDGALRMSIAVTECIAYTHCCLNPIIYAFVGQKFMKRALQLMKKCVPGMHLPFVRDISDSSFKKSSFSSRSS